MILLITDIFAVAEGGIDAGAMIALMMFMMLISYLRRGTL